MLSHRFYYAFKPFVPWRVRMAGRRMLARYKRKIHHDSWPIDERTATRPVGWPGWPDGKRMSFVITHDVEGPEGLAKCRQLAELEMKLGFRSSFNFIPEGPYKVPSELRTWLTDNGFEVGVHDLNHDGKLFASKSGFVAKAHRINHYIREWGAYGYRSGFMLRNLDWLHGLSLRYDSSTFDTDPFEPQPDDVGTIFPYWIPSSFAGVSDYMTEGVNSGYVELPYTLPQDSTLFLVLRERTPDIWLKKCDWIADHGGMALVNVHPDYVQFDGDRPSARTYPVAQYMRLLEHVRDRHGMSSWRPLPRDMADFVMRLETRPVRYRPRRVCMITHSFYEVDNRVTRYAEALASRGDHVDVLSLRRSPEVPKSEIIEGVHVHRLQNRFGKNERSILSFLWPALRFLVTTSWWVTRHNFRKRYDVVHVHNIPDFLVFTAWHPKLTGARLILDIHDIVPEFFGSKFGGRKKYAIALLRWMERCSAEFADHIIISNHLWQNLYTARTGTADRCSVFINNVNHRVFQPQLRTRNDGKLQVLFPGGLQWHQGLDIALRAFVRVKQELPNAEFQIYGDGNMKPALLKLRDELGLRDAVQFFDPVRLTDIAQVMANADLGVVPKRADSFGNEAYSTKIMEFMSVGVPVVVSSTKIDRFYFNDEVVRFFESGNADALADAMIAVLRDQELRRQMTIRASAYARQNSWDTRKADYLQLVDSIRGISGLREAHAGHKSTNPIDPEIAAN
jgi:glycosyltransferase involved in cell wall biosynthesis